MNSEFGSHSIFVGGWQRENESENEVFLSRHIKMEDGKSYKMTVVCRKPNGQTSLGSSANSFQAEESVKKVIESAEKQIAAFVSVYTKESDKPFTVSLKTDVTKRTGAVAVKHLSDSGKTTELSLADIKARNIQEYTATVDLINVLANSYFQQMAQPPNVPSISSHRGVSDSMVCSFQEVSSERPKSIQEPKACAEKALALIEKIRRDEPGKIPVEDRYGIRKWEVELDGVSYEVNEYGKNAYNGAKVEDFQKRQELVMAAALKCAQLKTNQNRKETVAALEVLNDNFYKTLNSPEYQLDLSVMQQGNEATAHYKKVNEKALQLIGQFTRDAQYLLDKASDEGCSMRDLKAQEKEIVLERGRPIVINCFSFEGERYMSMQIPQSKVEVEGKRTLGKTIPSSLRERPGLVNYVTTHFGKIGPDDSLRILYQAIRHSSYPPIAIEDSALRQAYAMRNVKQQMVDLAEKELEKNPVETSFENPLSISLRTMMLFTPVIGDSVRNRSKGVFGIWKGESEVTQLEESALALLLMNNRTVPLQIEGKTVWVKLDSSFMNFGANEEAAGIGLGMIPHASYEKRANARGFFEFERDVERFLKPALGEALSDLKLNEESAALHKAEKALTDVLQAHEKNLSTAYENLEKLYERYAEAPNVELKEQINKERGAIFELEKKINSKYVALEEIKKEHFIQNLSQIEAKEQEIRNQMDQSIERASDPKEKEGLESLRDVQLNFSMAKKLYYTRAYQNPMTVMELQTLYIQTQSMMDNYVEFFCKSGEDRTGRVDDKVQERVLFADLNGRQAEQTKGDQEKIERDFSPVVHAYSASQNNTEHNSNARGEQIGSKVNSHLPAEIDRLQGTMAKKVFTRAEKLSPSLFAQEVKGEYLRKAA